MKIEKSQQKRYNLKFFYFFIFKVLFVNILISIFFSCTNKKKVEKVDAKHYITILGIAQDAGFPHIDNPSEWNELKQNSNKEELVVSLGLVDDQLKSKWLFEATPDMPEQLHNLENDYLKKETIIDGIFLTHAHIGHYTGLMHFGREAMGAHKIPVYAMPKMKLFLEENGPWNQLVKLNNIELKPLKADSTIVLNKNFKVTPFLVPHRDEYSETVGYKIQGPKKSALFIPDINKWQLWKKNIVHETKKVDYAFVDATFFREGEIPRPMSEVPHPFIQETIHLFKDETLATKSKVIFIHFNHSNPAILEKHQLKDSILDLGFRFARQGDVFEL